MNQRTRQSRSQRNSAISRQVTARIPLKLHGYLGRRAQLLDETPGSYLGMILRAWFTEGAPPVNDYEARMLAEAGSAGMRSRR